MRDPDLIPRSKHGNERDLAQIGFSTTSARQDAAFVKAMQRAGFTLTAPSTEPGTRAPIFNYLRD